MSWCRRCKNDHASKQRKANRALESTRTYARELRKRYGLTLDEYEKLSASGCAICGVSAGSRRLCVDHDHKTGKIRGILCGNCNSGLGRFKDDPELLRKAAQYLAE